MSKVIFIFLILTGSFSSWAQVSIKEAINKGYAISNLLKAQDNDEHAKYIRIVNAKMDKLFKVEGSAAYQYKTRRPSSPLPGSGNIGTHHTYDLNVKISQSIWDGGILKKKMNVREVAHELSSNNTALIKIQIKGAIIGSYLNYRSLLKQKKIQKALLDNLLLHEKRVKDLYKEELLMKTDLLETKKLKLSRVNLINELDELIELETLEFRKLCGYTPSEIDLWTLRTDITGSNTLKYFESKHPIMKAYNLKLSKEKISGQIVQAAYQPQIRGYAAVHYGKPGVDFFDNKWQIYGEGGINLSLKLFDWNRKRREKQITGHNISRIKLEKNETYWETSKSIRQLFKSIKSINYRLKNLGEIITVAEEECRLKQDLYKEHQISNIEYLRALTTKDEHISQQEALTCALELTKLRILITSGLIMEAI